MEEGKLRLVYCPTDDMVADMLTKALPSAKVKLWNIQTLSLVPPGHLCFIRMLRMLHFYLWTYIKTCVVMGIQVILSYPFDRL